MVKLSQKLPEVNPQGKRVTNRSVCAHFFKSPMIRADGTFTVCSKDCKSFFKLGNLNQTAFEDLWHSDKLLKYRIYEILGEYEKLPKLCQDCSPDWVLSHQEVKEFLKNMGLEELYRLYSRRISKGLKVLFISPQPIEDIKPPVEVALELASIAAYISYEFQPKIIDMGFERKTIKDIIQQVSEGGYSLVVISGEVHQAKNGFKVARAIKSEFPEILTVFAGPFYSHVASGVLMHDFADFVIKGDIEATLTDLLDSIVSADMNPSKILGLCWKKGKQIIENPSRDCLPPKEIMMPAREHLPSHGLIEGGSRAAIQCSRVCPVNYDVMALLKPEGIRFRFPETIIGEIKQIMDDYMVDAFSFVDESFTSNRKFVIGLCELMIMNRLNIHWSARTFARLVDEPLLKLMKEAGCDKLELLVVEEGQKKESSNTFDLCKRLGINAEMANKRFGDSSSHPKANEKPVKDILLERGFGFERFQSRKHAVKSEHKNKQVIEITPDIWDHASFDVWSAFYWTGDGSIKKGYTHVLGKNVGFIEYSFLNEMATVKEITIKVRMSSHSKRSKRVKENASEVTLYINGIPLKPQIIYYYWPECPIHTWRIKDGKIIKKIAKGVNKIRFEVREDAKYKNGLTIYYKSLSTDKDTMPIIIELR